MVETPSWLVEKVTEETEAGYNNGYFDTARAVAGLPEGERDDAMFRFACSLRARDYPRDLAEGFVVTAAGNCDPPFPEDQARQKVDNAYGAYPPGVGSKIQSQQSQSLNRVGPVGLNESTNVVDLQKPLQAVSLGTVARPKPRRWVVKDLFPRGHMSLIYGEGGMAKSFLALDAGFCVASDLDTWLDYSIVTGPVLYLDFELDLEEQSRRAHDLAAGKGLDRPPVNLHYVGGLGYTSQEAFQAAYDTVVEHGVVLVVIDSLGLALEGDAESSTDVISFVRRYIDPLRADGAAILAVDHQAKRIKGDRYTDKTAFGSVYKTNLARSVLQVGGDWRDNAFEATLTHKKANFGPRQPDILATVRFDVERIGIAPSFDFGPRAPVEEPATAADAVLEVVRDGGPMYNTDIAKAADIDIKTVRNRVKDLIDSGRLEYTGEKRGNAKEVRVTPSPHDPQDVPSDPPANPDPGDEDGLGDDLDRGAG